MLSEKQAQIVELARQGLDLKGIAKNMRTEAHLVSANITRATNNGDWPKDLKVAGHHTAPAVAGASTSSAGDTRPEMSPAEGYRPKISTAPDLSRDQILRLQSQIEQTGQVPTELLDAINRGGETVNPLLIMGCTIQFVRLCGGRIAAHQVIEDIYDAMRAFTDGTGVRSSVG